MAWSVRDTLYGYIPKVRQQKRSSVCIVHCINVLPLVTNNIPILHPYYATVLFCTSYYVHEYTAEFVPPISYTCQLI